MQPDLDFSRMYPGMRIEVGKCENAFAQEIHNQLPLEAIVTEVSSNKRLIEVSFDLGYRTLSQMIFCSWRDVPITVVGVKGVNPL